MTDELLYDVAGGIGRITFNRPAARNALTFPLHDRLAEIGADLGQALIHRKGQRVARGGAVEGDTADTAGDVVEQFIGHVCVPVRSEQYSAPAGSPAPLAAFL